MNEIKFKAVSNGGTICVIPLGDLHIGSEYFCESKLKEVIDEVLSNDNYYVILGGDYIQNNTKTIKYNDIYEEPSVDEQLALAKELLKPLAMPDEKHPKGRILAMLEGNHEERSRVVGLSPAKMLCSALTMEGNELDKRFSDSECVIFITSNRRSKKMDGSHITYTIDCTHGKGAGSSLGSALNQLHKMSIRLSGCMCYVMFHHHKPIVAKQDHLNINDSNQRVKRETQLLVMGNAFTLNAKYAEKSSLEPTSLAVPHIWFKAIRLSHRTDGKEKDVSYKTCDCIL